MQNRKHTFACAAGARCGVTHLVKFNFIFLFSPENPPVVYIFMCTACVQKQVLKTNVGARACLLLLQTGYFVSIVRAFHLFFAVKRMFRCKDVRGREVQENSVF